MAEPLNLASLQLVQDELVATIEQAANRLEQFSRDRNNAELLQACIDYIKQIKGTLSLLQMRGVDVLADELVAHTTEFTLGDDSIDSELELISTAFFILPRYFEYCLQSARSMPVVLLPHINQLRQARRAPPLPESYYFDYQLPSVGPRKGQSSAVLGEDFGALTRRLRHMYQVGLVQVLRGAQLRPALGMMERALERLASVTGGRPAGNLWWVASVALSVIRAEQMDLNDSRKRLIGRLDRKIKQLQQDGQAQLDTEPDPDLLKELLYIIALSRSESPTAGAVISAYELPALPFTEGELARELGHLNGPSANTFASMSEELRGELRNAKLILERAVQGGSEMLRESPELVDTLKKVAGILSVVGLSAPSQCLNEEVTKILAWHQRDEPVAPEELLEVADSLLYVESTIGGLHRSKPSDDQIRALNAISRDEVVSSSQLAEAQRVVFEEAQNGLVLVKRALNAFVESQFDKGHIRNVNATLNSVRGGLVVMNYARAAHIVDQSIQFIDQALLKNEQPATEKHRLETFADAVISLEHYLDSLRNGVSNSDKALQIAEESLEALGFKAYQAG
ncbi:pilus assembly protein [Marinimicrobium alkaliphilum]|uniref:pilus assembly protein n=1 Tax=Marinimicrobium alkaliphilum TaxID=2202654 RepID=UPI0018E07384|nr:pilus assembly protein [Marinimicrobium alkaliphilum]